eukprot:g81529.t1
MTARSNSMASPDKQPKQQEQEQEQENKPTQGGKHRRVHGHVFKHPANTRSWMAGDQRFTVDKKYSPTECIGKGSYGTVCSALDRNTKQKVAIKRCNDVFRNRLHANRCLREVDLLRQMTHKNIIRMVDLIVPPHDDRADSFNEIYML